MGISDIDNLCHVNVLLLLVLQHAFTSNIVAQAGVLVAVAWWSSRPGTAGAPRPTR